MNIDLSVPQLLDELESNLINVIAQRQLTVPLMIGIRKGGVWIAEKLHQRLGVKEPLGLLDISFYRDDFSHTGVNPDVKPSQLPTQIDGRDIILVDDVFQTGRTIRAALNEIFDYGRPNQVILAVLIERDGKHIPISPDCVGTKLTLDAGQRIKLSGPDPLVIQVQSTSGDA